MSISELPNSPNGIGKNASTKSPALAEVAAVKAAPTQGTFFSIFLI